MKAIAGVLIALTCVAADKPEFFGEAQPASGPKVGKKLPDSLRVTLVNATQRSSVSNALE